MLTRIWFRDTQQREHVLFWLVEPLVQQWTQQPWQKTYLSEPKHLVDMFSKTHMSWSVVHVLICFEKALKGSARNSTPENTSSNPMASAIPQIMPPLLRVRLLILYGASYVKYILFCLKNKKSGYSSLLVLEKVCKKTKIRNKCSI